VATEINIRIRKEEKDYVYPFLVCTEDKEPINNENLSWSDALQLLINVFLNASKKQTFYMKDSRGAEIFQLP
jgi:hypothetical protein